MDARGVEGKARSIYQYDISKVRRSDISEEVWKTFSNTIAHCTRLLLFQQWLEHDGEAQEGLRHGFSSGRNTSPAVQLGEACGHAEPRQVLNGYTRTFPAVLIFQTSGVFFAKNREKEERKKYEKLRGQSAVTKPTNHFMFVQAVSSREHTSTHVTYVRTARPGTNKKRRPHARTRRGAERLKCHADT